MTSKEALETLRYEGYSQEVYITIEKDLEVLELLKPIIKASVNMSNHGISNGILAMNIKTNKLLKEWLEK